MLYSPRGEAQLRELLAKGLPSPAWLVDRDLSLTWCNPPSPEAEAAGSVCTAVRLADPQAWATAHHRALQGETCGFDVTTCGHTYRCSVAPVKDLTGAIVAAVGIATDVTDFAQVVREFNRAQQEHSELIDNIDGIVWEANASDVRFTLVSKQAERLLGYPTQRWLDEPDFWVSHLHPDDRKWAPAFCVKATAEGRPHEFEYRMIAADGRTVWLRDIVSVIVEDQRPIKLRGIMVDVTEQHWNKERLQHMVSLLRATLDSTTDGLLVVNLHGRIVAYNRRYQDMWRIPDGVMDFRRDDRVIEHVLGLLEHPEQFLARVRELYAAPEAESLDDHIELRDGRVIERASAPQRQGETIIGRVWSFRDVTQRVRAEQERDRLLVAEQAARVAVEESFALLEHLPQQRADRTGVPRS
ncbi:PAS domain-containing protein [Archangium lansingense]|uniref:PAS domain-containing protein n=1 Tax=Archangium lansingense TaxID=2995310 RepID=UPI003B7DD93D